MTFQYDKEGALGKGTNFPQQAVISNVCDIGVHMLTSEEGGGGGVKEEVLLTAYNK